MSNTITSTLIGQLVQDTHFPDWWKSEKIAIPFFNDEELVITFTDFEPELDKTFIEEANLALQNFLNLNQQDREATSVLVYKNCSDFLDAVGVGEEDQHLTNLKDENEIWSYVYPSQIYVSRRVSKEDQDIYIQIGCGCDWEKEHGLQLIFRQGKKLTRVSDIDGHLTESDANSDHEDETSFQF